MSMSCSFLGSLGMATAIPKEPRQEQSMTGERTMYDKRLVDTIISGLLLMIILSDTQTLQLFTINLKRGFKLYLQSY